MALIMYGINNCDTVKKARAWLTENQIAYTFHDFKKAGITLETLHNWLQDIPLETLLNRRGTSWRNLSDAVKATAEHEEQALALMVENPSLIKRPVITIDNRVKAVGFLNDRYLALFK